MISDKFNLGHLMKNAKKIQELMQQAQKQLSKIEVTGESGAGMVQVTLTAQHEVINFILSDELLKESKEVIEDLIKAALNDANQKVIKITQEKVMFTGSGSLFDNDEGR
ncbi:YbaB/EbfC family nucleoid-associated protein [Coxiella endosymbiont of Rhipicephalus microplus]|uniref:YbaB/EbfC family nucleoid-associated protein n=1 Tax=Coxiella endosymbiont of Rhipicephalus microplus TaxID=1656186 RepID=UPI000C802CA8|nr:YbaB/EbfC family nucleoid-associated protein [Coxiella endosymbiont of Rhipicephalus microplus]